MKKYSYDDGKTQVRECDDTNDLVNAMLEAGLTPEPLPTLPLEVEKDGKKWRFIYSDTQKSA